MENARRRALLALALPAATAWCRPLLAQTKPDTGTATQGTAPAGTAVPPAVTVPPATPPGAPSSPSSPSSPSAATPPAAADPAATTAKTATADEGADLPGDRKLATAANATDHPPIGPGAKGAAALRAQILLDRALFSQGEIDGSYGRFTQRAVAAFQESRGLSSSGRVDRETWAALVEVAGEAPVLTRYEISADDVKGPFAEVPDDMQAKAKLPRLGYASPLEGLAEKFHASPVLLRKLNPGVAFDRAGTALLVPSVTPAGTLPKARSVRVSKAERALRALDAQGRLVAYFPVTIGSERHDPLPLGTWKIRTIALDPKYYYNPKRFWEADPKAAKAVLAPGPNNPVGVAWLDLSKENYGIHGSAKPGTIGRSASHGCVNLTNWDVTRLAKMVEAGTEAVFTA